MRNGKKAARWFLYAALTVGTACVSLMGYEQVMQVRSEKTLDLTTWVSKKRIAQLMQFHGTDGLKVTRDEVFILRDSRWVPVMKRRSG